MLWFLGEPWRMLQLPMRRVISKAGGIAVLIAGEVILAVLGLYQLRWESVMPFTCLCFPAGPRAPREGAAASALEHPSAALALSSVLPSGFILLPSLPPALTGSQGNS